MKRAHVVGPWAGTGAKPTPYRPQLAIDYALLKYSDATGQPAQNLVPSPNLFTADITCTDAVMAAILADANYSVVWSDTL
jgi:hypothetical protein